MNKDEQSVTYEAGLNKEYETLTTRHKRIKALSEEEINKYLRNPNEPKKVITIQGTYGSGKTQLLYHLFKYTWENDGIGIYTHLEKILPEEKMSPTKYADYLKELVNQEIGLLQEGKSTLMNGEVKKYAVECIRKTNSDSHSLVVFVDEFEQQYRALDGKVESDDHSPLRAVLESVVNDENYFYLILAFAPVSFYEFNKGEAQTSRTLPLIIPIVEPNAFRKKIENIGNLAWWMGRGRFRGISKMQETFQNNVPNIHEISKRELSTVCQNIGSVGRVAALEFGSIEAIRDFNAFREFLIPLEVKENGSEMYSENRKIVKKCKYYDSARQDVETIIEKLLTASDISQKTDIGYYLSVLLDGFSTYDDKIPLFMEQDDWKELFEMVEDVILEFEGEERLPSEDLKKLHDNIENALEDFAYGIRHTEGLEDGYCISPAFMRKLFPFPISSPNLIKKPITEMRETLSDQTYLARTQHDIPIFFFLNEDKIKKFLDNQGKDFLNETKMLIIVNLGKDMEITLSKLAQWLKKEKRLKIITLSDILSDFLIGFIFWLKQEKGKTLPIDNLYECLTENQTISEKDKARKIKYYSSRIKEYFETELPKPPKSKYGLQDKTGFNDFIDGRVGFPSETIGFSFVRNERDWKIMFEFKRNFKKSTFIQNESSNRRTGIPTAIERLVIEEQKRERKHKGNQVILSSVLEKIYENFNEHVEDLRDIVDEVNKEDFIQIPLDKDCEIIFEGIFLYLKDWHDPSKAQEEIRSIKEKWGKIIKSVEDISNKIKNFEELTNNNLPLTHRLEEDRDIIGSLGNILKECEEDASPYTKFLLSTFMEKIRELVEQELNKIEKGFSQISYRLKGEIEKYNSAFDAIENFERDTFIWIEKEKVTVQQEIQQQFKENVCDALDRGGRIDIETISISDDIIEEIKNITKELGELRKIDNSIKECKELAKEINEKLDKWEEA